MVEFFKKIEDAIKSVPILDKSLQIITLFIIVFGIAYIILRLAKKSIAVSQRKFGEAGKKRAETLFKLVKSISKYITIPTFIILLLPIFGLDPTAVFASASIVGVVVGFALQDFLKDIVSGLFIVFERVYEVEDYITINKDYTGTVKSISLKVTTLEGWTGEIYTINNRDVKDVINFTNADFAIVVNRIKVSKDTKLDDFKRVFNGSVSDILTQFKEQLISTPIIKGVDSIEQNGYVIEIHSKVKALEQYQFRRDFNCFLIELCMKNNIDIPYEKVEVLDGKDRI